MSSARRSSATSRRSRERADQHRRRPVERRAPGDGHAAAATSSRPTSGRRGGRGRRTRAGARRALGVRARRPERGVSPRPTARSCHSLPEPRRQRGQVLARGGPHLHLRRAAGRDSAEVRVSDQGVGIPRGRPAQRIFSKFYRGGERRARACMERGLGFSSRAGCVLAHGREDLGRVEGRPGVDLRLRAACRGRGPRRGPAGRGDGLMALTVLVVDDEAPIRLLCRVNLEAEGASVLEAENGRAGARAGPARAARRHPPRRDDARARRVDGRGAPARGRRDPPHPDHLLDRAGRHSRPSPGARRRRRSTTSRSRSTRSSWPRSSRRSSAPSSGASARSSAPRSSPRSAICSERPKSLARSARGRSRRGRGPRRRSARRRSPRPARRRPRPPRARGSTIATTVARVAGMWRSAVIMQMNGTTVPSTTM